jgi:cell division protein FtsW
MKQHATRKPLPRAIVHNEPTFDRWLIFALVALVSLGVVMVASASISIAARKHGYEFYYVQRHLVALCIGAGIGYLLYSQGLEWVRRLSPYGLLIAIVLLVLVLIPGIGHRVNGASRWLAFKGVTIQSAEVAKLAMIVYLAGYLVRHQDQVRHKLRGFINPIGVLTLLSLLLLFEPDMGSTAVLSATTLGMVLLAGAPIPTFACIGAVITGVFGGLVVLEPYRLARWISFRDPWLHADGSGYQLAQSLIAFGRGHWVGVGLGNSVQKLFYLPEVHTDFIFAVIGEELGVAGTLLVIALFLFLVWRIFRIGARAEAAGQYFGANLAYGVALLIGIEAFFNIGVNIGFFPTKGLTLPFISYGNNSTIIMCASIALVFRVAYESRAERPASAPLEMTDRLAPAVAHE